MKIDCQPRGKYLLIRAEGRLDASWATYFTETLLAQIRQGRHRLILDAEPMAFLSSAGIRALLRVYKELKAVDGEFRIIQATAFVEQTLRTSGFQMWLAQGPPPDLPPAGALEEAGEAGQTGIERYQLNEKAVLTAAEPVCWRPWQQVDPDRVKTLTFDRDAFCLGIGSAAATFEEARGRFGEFLVVAGHVVFQPPDEQSPPDYLIPEQRFLPRMQCLQSLSWTGEMRHLIRFSPTDSTPFYPMSALMALVLDQTGGRPAGFVAAGEIEGLVGAALIRSPGHITGQGPIGFPEIRDWLTFCGERSFARQQALLAGVVAAAAGPLFPAPADASKTVAHVHAAVFPYRPLPNGRIELTAATEKFFNGPPPLAVVHLTHDDRPAVGLGESALVRGACWFGPLENPEVLS